MSWFKTMLIGVVGSFLGGFAVYLIAGGSPIQGTGWIGSVAAVWFSTRNDRKRIASGA